MGIKLHDMGPSDSGRGRNYAFHCPGCEHGHAFEVPRWSWNGSMDKPSFRPSLDINKDHPASHCHLVMQDGMIQFQGDCFHKLKGQKVEIPDWDD